MQATVFPNPSTSLPKPFFHQQRSILSFMESGLKLLPGQRFCPMEDELLMFYLEPKVNGKKVPGNEDVICELDLYGDEDPWKIWERFEREKANDLRRNKDLYFFTQKKKKSARSSRASRTVGNGGTWKGQNGARDVCLVDQNQKTTPTVLGSKKTYTYKNEGSVHHGRWIMYEYELDESLILHNKVNKNEYVLCLLRKNDVLPEKKRKRQEEDEMVEDYVVDDDGGKSDDNNSELMMMQQEKRQRLLPPSVQDEQEQFLPAEPSSEYGQVADAVPTPLEGVPLFLDENMGLLTPPMLEEAELQQLFNGEFLQGGQIPLEEEPVDAMQVFENCGQQQLEVEPQGPQTREENLGQQCQVPTFSANEIVGGIGFDQAENMVQQMGAEALGEVDLYGGNGGDAIVGESWSMSFMESLMNDELPTTVEMGDSNAAYSDFGYNLEF
ncbi:hypothetical protein ACLB2K_023063 [Fragaria x ananassa]